MPAGKDTKIWFGCEQELCQVGYVSCLLYDFYKLWIKALWAKHCKRRIKFTDWENKFQH